jgi:hypothetical protein
MIEILFGIQLAARMKTILFVKYQEVINYFNKGFYLKLKFSLENKPLFTTPSPGSCPSSEWISYESNCYLFERTIRNYGEAKFDCSKKGASVVSIKTKDEMEFITKNVGSRRIQVQLWIGLEKNTDTGRIN